MSTDIRIKKSGSTLVPSTLRSGELAYSWSSDKLFIGTGTETGSPPAAPNIETIGGKLYVDMLDHTAGTLTASSAVVVDSNKKIDELKIGTGSTSGNIELYDTGSTAVKLQAPGTISSGYTLTLPTATGTADQLLKTNGSGQLSFFTIDTDDVAEATNLWYTDERVYDAVAAMVSNGSQTNITVTSTDNTDDLTFSVATATTSVLGVASFNSNDFAVSTGDVTIKPLGVSNAQLAGSITNAKLVNSFVVVGSDTVNLGDTITDVNGLTSLDVDNLTLDGNDISTTNSNGDLTLTPNGTGTVTVPSGYESRAGFSSQSLANKAYVDSVASGLDVKKSVRVATTGAGTLSTSFANGQTIDNITLVTGDRILIKDQSTGSENGIYVVASSGAPSRAFDFDTDTEVTPGAFVFVEEGDTNADSGWVLTNDGTVTVGSTALSFEQFSGAGQITAGNGLTKNGNTIDAVGTSNRIDVSANAIDISSSYVGQTSITTLGTISTGTWNATTVSATYGGTGLSSYTIGDIVYADSTSTLAKLGIGSNGDILTISAGVPSWTATISLTSNVSGTLPVTNGGTGLSTVATGDVLYASASNTLSALTGPGNTVGYLLQNNSSGLPVWSNVIDGGTF